MIYKKTSC